MSKDYPEGNHGELVATAYRPEMTFDHSGPVPLANLGVRVLNWLGVKPWWYDREAVNAAERVVHAAIEGSLHEAAEFVDGVASQVLTEHNRYTVEEQ